MIALQTLRLPFGEMLAGATERGICLLEFFENGRTNMQLTRLETLFEGSSEHSDSEYFGPLRTQLAEYFEGERSEFSIPMDIRGTEFQVRAWNSLRKIPYGQTRSYEEQATAVGSPRAVRAVANANRNNRISILLPCHRVIGKNGSLTGYGGGLDRKRILLELEGALPETKTSEQMSLFQT